MINPLTVYQQRLSELGNELRILEKRKSLLGWLRFFSLIIGFFLLWKLWSAGILVALVAFSVCFGLFLFILSKDLNNNTAIENIKRLQLINKTEIEVLNHHFTFLPDGSQNKPELHDYSNDLDIFGRASLFQYINRCTTEHGNKLFADWLLKPSPATKILQNQEAIKELAPQLEWRQQLQSYGQALPISIATEK